MGRLILPIAAVVLAMAAFQVSAAFAKGLFPALGPTGAAALTRPWRGLRRDAPWGALLGLGVSTGLAVILFYAAIDRLPLGVAIALQFLGPLAVALAGSRRLRDVAWAILAATGVWSLVGRGAGGASIDLLGVGYALGAAAGWAGYIVFGRVAGGAFGRNAATFATAIAALIVLPLGVERAASALSRPDLIGLALAVALFSTVIPFSLELYAMPRMPARTFAVFTALEPAFGAVAGLILLGERLAWTQVGGIIAVMIAAAGATWSGADEAEPTPPPGLG